MDTPVPVRLDTLLASELPKIEGPKGFKIYDVDGNVYFCASYFWDEEGLKLDGSNVATMVVFRPANGPDKGRIHKLLTTRLDRIVDVSE